MAAVVNRPGGPESPLAFETSTISNQFEFHDLSDLLRRVLQELPEAQKEAIHLASKGISRREIAAKSKAFPGNRDNAAAFGLVAKSAWSELAR